MPTVQEIAAMLNAPVRSGTDAQSITGVASLTDAGPQEISFSLQRTLSEAACRDPRWGGDC